MNLLVQKHRYLQPPPPYPEEKDQSAIVFIVALSIFISYSCEHRVKLTENNIFSDDNFVSVSNWSNKRINRIANYDLKRT